MAHVNYFAYGWVTPAFSYLLSFLGSLLGLHATARARMAASGASRGRWLALAAWSIGGTGIWAMHFIAMIGFEVDGSSVRFNLATTVASWLTAIIVVGAGLFVVGYGAPSFPKVLIGGLFSGLGVAAMHYTGMGAMVVDGTTSYSTTLVIASVVIAVVAATVALWFTVNVRTPLAIAGAAAIMGVAVCGMHYTGMIAMHVRLNPLPGQVAGWNSLSFLVPIFVVVLMVVVALGYSLLNSLSSSDRDSLEELQSRLGGGDASLDQVTAGWRIGTGRPQQRE